MTQEEAKTILSQVVDRPADELFTERSAIYPTITATQALQALQTAAAAERSRLLEEAALPIPVNAFHATCPNCQTSVDVIPSNNTFIFKQSETADPDDFYKWATQFHKLHGRRPASGDCFTWMRSRCAALLLKEREKAIKKAISWMIDEQLTSEATEHARRLPEYKAHVIQKLYDLFDSQRKKGDSERKVGGSER